MYTDGLLAAAADSFDCLLPFDEHAHICAFLQTCTIHVYGSCSDGPLSILVVEVKFLLL